MGTTYPGPLLITFSQMGELSRANTLAAAFTEQEWLLDMRGLLSDSYNGDWLDHDYRADGTTSMSCTVKQVCSET